jgi:hypothetical protein
MRKALGAVGGVAGAALGSIAGNQIAGAVGGTKPAPGLRRIGTGFSNFERRGSNNNALDISLDPSIRAGQESFLGRVGGLRDSVDPAFDFFQDELGGIRSQVQGLEADFQGNQSAFREQSLNPVRESIARGRGGLNRELGRTGVRGTFADQSRSNFELDAGRTLSDAEANIENQRIQNLSGLLGLDANLLQQGLQSEVGRNQLLLNLEQSLANVSTERFNQELSLLGLGTGVGVTPLQQAQQMNQQGIFAGEATKAIGGILGSFGGGGGSPFRSSVPGPHS